MRDGWSTGGDSHAAIGHDHRADHGVCAVRGEKGDNLGNFLRLRSTANGRGFAVLGKTTRAVADHASKDVGDDIADSDRVDADAVLDGFERKCTGQLG